MKLIESKHNYCLKFTDDQVMTFLLDHPEGFKRMGCIHNKYAGPYSLYNKLKSRGYKPNLDDLLARYGTFTACQRCQSFNGDWSEIWEALK